MFEAKLLPSRLQDKFHPTWLCVTLWLLPNLCHGRLAEEHPNAPPLPEVSEKPPPLRALHCFYSDPEDCPAPTAECACRKAASNPQAMVCCNVNNFRLKEGLACAGFVAQKSDAVLALHIRNATLDEFDLSQPIYKRLTSIAITDGNITRLTGEFLKMSPATCVNVSNNYLVGVEPRAFANLYNLTMLDMSYNNLTKMPNFRVGNKFVLDIKGNDGMLCKSVLESLNRTGVGGDVEFRNAEDTFCASSKTFQWFNSTELVPLKQVELVYELEYKCNEVQHGTSTEPCSCEPLRWDILPGLPPTISVGVDCSGRGLTTLPENLPPNTIALNVSNNNITSLNALNHHPSYEHMRQFVATNNQIESILELEGSRFIDNFALLNLVGNKLSKIPTYILSNTFDRNWNPRLVYLGKNKLKCDCNSAKSLKVWLLGKTKNIPDYDQIECENTPFKVIDLIETKMCQYQRDWTDYIYYVIAAEVILLVCLILKVSYDYWVFKTAGYLPWPASKMPKLPCDWLCET